MEETVIYNGTAYEIRRNARRKYIAVVRDGSGKIYIAVPKQYKLTDATTEQFVPLLDKIIKRTAALPQAKNYAEGETFLFCGTEYPLHITEGKGLEFKDNAFWLGRNSLDKAKQLFEKWYKRALFDRLSKILPPLCKRLSVQPAKISIRNTETRWGSCSSKGNITFCTRLALAPDSLLEYVAVHELCHLKQMNHSPDFWSEVRKTIPDCEDRRSLLNKNSYIYKWW